MTYKDKLECELDIQDAELASGLLIEMGMHGTAQLIGPFPKDTAEIYEAIARLQAEETPDDPPISYRVVLLFPASDTKR